jgi:23S rRNA (cytosine1962-C5)-methyltransferase
MKEKKVILKAGKDKAIRNRHHWIFSGAVQTLPNFQDGDLLSVYDSSGHLLGSAYFNHRSSIIGRMVSFDDTSPLKAIEQRLEAAIALRQALFNTNETNAFRLVNGEGDGLPGLIIDRYNQVLVLQISTKGMDVLKDWIVRYLQEKLQPQMIYEKSLLSTRREEGLKDSQGMLAGNFIGETAVKENGLQFLVSFEKSQKTGFFLDHRDMRAWIQSVAKNKRILNAFCYTGGFTVYALAGGTKTVHSVDISEEAVEKTKRHVELNGFDSAQQQFSCEDVFQFLREQELPYDIVILDPPAFAKRQKDVIPACRGYKDINRLAMQKMPPRSLLLTCSCSHYVDEELFQKVLFQAASEARRQVRIIGKHRLAADHPINIFHPESEYLKSFVLYVE